MSKKSTGTRVTNCVAFNNGRSGFNLPADTVYTGSVAYGNGLDGFTVSDDENSDLRNVLHQLITDIDELKLSSDSEQELRSDIDTIQAQLKSPKSKKNIIKQSLISIRNIVEGITSASLSACIVMLISKY